MKHPTLKLRFAKTVSLALLILPLSSLAKEPVAKFKKDVGSVVQFNHSTRFVPPENLPIVETEARETVTPKQEADRLTAVAVTPDGQTYTAEVTAEDLKLLSRALERWSGSFEGIRTGKTGKRKPSALERSALSDEFAPESVIGTDERVQVGNTTVYPWRTIGRIELGCTGTLIGPRHVLTAGHCVYDIDTDKWYSQLDFSPAQNATTLPYGGPIAWSKAISVKGWTRDHKRDYDYAMIVLSSPIGNTVGWLGYGYDNNLPKYTVNINGYPGDKPDGTMWHSHCGLELIQTYRLYYDCDTWRGMSGSAAYAYFPATSSRIIYGIHAYGVDSTGYNGATRIRKAVFDNLKGWKAGNP